MTVVGKNSPFGFKANSDYVNYLKIQTTSSIPEITVVASSGLKINAGGTNAFRVMGWKAGLFVMLVDFGKGALATYLFSQEKAYRRIKRVIAWILILFLLCSFPVISYSKEAYNTFTPSANFGLM